VASSAELPFELSPLQAEVFFDGARFKVVVAGRRSGKTVLALEWLTVETLSRGPGALGMYVAPFRVQAKAIAWELLLKVTRDVRESKNESDLSVTLADGSRILVRGADDPESLEGVGVHALVLDEYARMRPQAWTHSLRPAVADTGGRVLFIGKPRGANHLAEAYERGRDPLSSDWRSWLFTTAEAGFVGADDIAEARATLPDRAFRQEFEASFEQAAGRVYPEFLTRTHVVSPRDVPARFRRVIVGTDWGYSSPGVMLAVGADSDGRLWCFDEEYHRERVVSAEPSGWLAIADRVLERCRARAHDVAFACDPSGAGHIAALRQHLSGRAVVYGADNGWHEGSRRVSCAMLNLRDGRPGLLVSNACPNLARELLGYCYAERRGVQTEEPVDANDHCCDALLYAALAHTSPPSVRLL